MKTRIWSLLVLIGLLACPYSALANAGTPLMWAGMLHLVFGNALIGVFEGLLIAWLFSLPKTTAVLLMIVANYFSAWVGGLFLGGRIVDLFHPDLNTGWRVFWIMVGLTYLLTLLLEWPFAAFCFRRAEGWFPRSLRANALAQSASYLVLFGWYWMASGTSLYTKLQVTSAAQLALPETVIVYFISAADGKAYKRSLVSGGQTEVRELRSTNTNDRLFVRPCQRDKTRWDLVARLQTGGSRDPTFVDVLTNLVVEAALDHRATHISPPQYEGTWFNFGEATPLGSATNGQWKFWAGFWPIEGLKAENKTTGASVHFSYETPFGAWTVRNAVCLPTDKVLFQLGDDQICAFDPQSHKVALLWHGRGPVPVIEKTESVRPDKGQRTQSQ